MIDVRGRRRAGGEDFRGVDQRARLRRRNAEDQQGGVGQHAVGHAEGAIHQLGHEADCEQRQEFSGHEWPLARRRLLSD
jgi:hypothetical protein